MGRLRHLVQRLLRRLLQQQLHLPDHPHRPAGCDIVTGDGLIEIQRQAVSVSNDETTYFTTGIQDHTRTRGRAIAFRPVGTWDVALVHPSCELDTARGVLDLVSADPAGAPWPSYTFQVGEVTDLIMEVFTTGQTMITQWQANDGVGVVDARVALSLDGGQTWDEPLLAGPFDGSVQWTVALSSAGSTRCRLRVGR